MSEIAKILLVEDDPEIARIVRDHLRRQGWLVTWASTGLESWEDFQSEPYDLVLLDLMLPEMDGFTVCKNIRLVSDVPLLMMSARAEDESKVRGLGLGADDYLTKPFSLTELAARIQSHLKRYDRYRNRKPRTTLHTYRGGLTIEPDQPRAWLNGEELFLTAKEWAILLLFIQHAHRTFTKTELYEQVWLQTEYGSNNTVTVHVKSLRDKLGEEVSHPMYIQTVWGSGYRFIGELVE